MKLVLTGATGFIGSQVLSDALANPTINALITLTRRPIPTSKLPTDHSKLTQLTLSDPDWLAYPESIQSHLADADAWIWALGAVSFPDAQTMRTVSIEYTLTALNFIAAQKRDKSVSFVYLSGALTEPDPSRKLWIKGDFRKCRGEVENRVLEFGKAEGVESCVARPGGVLKQGNPVAGMLALTGMTLRVEELSRWLVETGCEGGMDRAKRRRVENEEIRREGARALKG